MLVEVGVHRGLFGLPNPLGTYLYSYEHDSLLLTDHHMALLGSMPTTALVGVSLKEVHRLCGEAFSAPCMASVIGSFLLSPFAPWWKPDPDLIENDP